MIINFTLAKLANKDESASFAAAYIEDNFDNLPENVRNQLLHKLDAVLYKYYKKSVNNNILSELRQLSEPSNDSLKIFEANLYLAGDWVKSTSIGGCYDAAFTSAMSFVDII